MFDLIDDDEWFELGLALSNTVAALPKGSVLIEALQMPPFRLAISATGSEMAAVVTRPGLADLRSPREAVKAAVALAQAETRSTVDAVAVAVTQTNDGETYAIAVVGIPGEEKSFTTFGLGPGGHSIDVGYRVLEQLEGWAIRHNRPLTAAA